MLIRKLETEDLDTVCSLCLKAFMDSVAPGLSPEGVNTFQSIVAVDSVANRMNQDNDILVCEQEGALTGVIELREGCHVAMLFVAPDSQNKGIGRALFSAILPYIRTDIVTVSASLNSIPVYTRFGFVCAGGVDEKSGLKYQPMTLKLKKVLLRPDQ